MADLHLSQPERPNLAVPILLALAVLAIAGFLLFRYTPHTTAEIAVTRVDLLPTHVVFKSDTRIVGADQAEDNLYVLVTLRITDRLRLPLFLKDFTVTLVQADGATQPATSAVEHPQFANLFTSFPALGKLAAAQPTPPLLRERRIEPGQSAEGYVILRLPITPEIWQGRNNAVVTVDLYHQNSLSITIPKTTAPTLK